MSKSLLLLFGRGRAAGVFALVFRGEPGFYTEYTRTGTGFSIGPGGTPVSVPENVAMFDTSGSEKLYLSYASPNNPPGIVGTVNQPALQLQAQDIGATRSIKPFVSPLGTSYGLDGLFTGVDSQPAIGRVVFENFTTHAIGTVQPLLSTNGGTSILWIAADGTLTASDGTNTVTAASPLVAGTEYDFFIAWDEDEMWITVDTTEGTRATFTGAFPAIGDFLKYSLNNAIYHDVRNVLFDHDLISGSHTFLAHYLAHYLG